MNIFRKPHHVEVGPPMHGGAIDVPGENAPSRPVEVVLDKPPVEKGKARKINEGDLPELVTWLVPRLTDRHPRASYEGILSLMRAGMLGRNYYLVRSIGVVALAEAYSSPLEPRLTVRELWVRCNKVKKERTKGGFDWAMTPDLREETKIVRQAIIGWAKQINAVKCVFGEDSDIPLSDVYEADSAMKQKAIFVRDFDDEVK